MTTPSEHAEEARKVLAAERRMRKWVFRDKPATLQAKLAEIDGALKHLEALEKAVVPEQGSLFGPAQS